MSIIGAANRRCCACGASPDCPCECGQALLLGYTPGDETAGGFWCGDCGLGMDNVIAEEGCAPDAPVECDVPTSSYRCCRIACPADRISLTVTSGEDEVTFPDACIFFGIDHGPIDSGADDSIVRYRFALMIIAVKRDGPYVYFAQVQVDGFMFWRNTDCMELPDCNLLRDQGTMMAGSELNASAELERWSGAVDITFNDQYCIVEGGTRDWVHATSRRAAPLDATGFDLNDVDDSAAVDTVLTRLSQPALDVSWTFTPGITVETTHGPDPVCDWCE